MDVYHELREAEEREIEEASFRNNIDAEEEEETVPTGPAYALDITFWKHCVLAAAFGAVMGCVAYGYLEAIERVQEKWWGEDYGKDADSFELGNGKWIWVAIMTGGGFAVGVVKALIKFPKVVHGFFKEVQLEHVDPIHAPKIVLVSMLSLMSGSSLGPEAALGSLGGGIAQFWSEKRGLSKEMTSQHVVNGMAAAIGPLFPSPSIAVCCMTEIGQVETMHANEKYMSSIVMMTFASSISYAVFFALKEKTFFPFNPLALEYQFESGDQAKAAIIGILGGLFGVIHIIIAGICRGIFKAIRTRCPSRFVATILCPTLGGLAIGLLAVASPLTLGSGSKQSEQIVKMSLGKILPDQGLVPVSTGALVATAFLKSLTFGISKASGHIGGAIFPMIFIGASLGCVAFQAFDDEPELELVFSTACFMAAVPASVMAAPFTLLLMIAFTFQLGAAASTPIFVSTMAAHLTSCGFGIILSFIKAAERRRRAQQALA